MTRHTPLWEQAGSYPASVDRQLIGSLWPDGGCSGCEVHATTGMVLNIDPGRVVVPSSNNTGALLCVSDAIEGVTLTTAPATGTNRIDYVICQARGTDLDGGASNDFIFDVIEGPEVSAPSTPVGPDMPPNSSLLAWVYVAGGAAAIVDANVNDARPQPLAVPMAIVGAIQMYAGHTAPEGWLMCDGSAVSRTTYATLFSTVGTTYGAGDGSTTFNLPSLLDRMPVGAGVSYGLGVMGGESVHVLSGNEVGLHSHYFHDPQHYHSDNHYHIVQGPSGEWIAQRIATASGLQSVATDGNLQGTWSTQAIAQYNANVGQGNTSWQPTGGYVGYEGSNYYGGEYTAAGWGHNNMPPYTAINYLIKY